MTDARMTEVDSLAPAETVARSGDQGQVHRGAVKRTARRHRRVQQIAAALRLRSQGLTLAAIGHRLRLVHQRRSRSSRGGDDSQVAAATIPLPCTR